MNTKTAPLPHGIIRRDVRHGIIASFVLIVVILAVTVTQKWHEYKDERRAFNEARLENYRVIVSELDAIEHSTRTNAELRILLDELSSGLTHGRVTSEWLGKSSAVDAKAGGWVTVYRTKISEREKKEKLQKNLAKEK